MRDGHDSLVDWPLRSVVRHRNLVLQRVRPLPWQFGPIIDGIFETTRGMSLAEGV